MTLRGKIMHHDASTRHTFNKFETVMYPNLKLQIFKRGMRQNHLAKQIGISDAILSKIIHGYREPSEMERRVLSAYLEADENWLFEKFEGETTPALAGAPSLAKGSGKPLSDRR